MLLVMSLMDLHFGSKEYQVKVLFTFMKMVM